MKIYIKNMVCQGTRKFVLMELKKLGLKLKTFESGEMEFHRELSSEETEKLVYSLGKYGLEIMSRRNTMVNDIRLTFHKARPLIQVSEYKNAVSDLNDSEVSEVYFPEMQR